MKLTRPKTQIKKVTFFFFDRAMKSESINGMTGKLSFNSEGDRMNPIYWIKNVQQQGIVSVGFHGNKKGDPSVLELRTPIIWPNGDTEKPKGIQISSHLQVRTN